MIREPRQTRSKATRQALLEATIELLAARGWSATTVGQVAEAAGVSRGAAQHHFPTRDDLVAGTLDFMFSERLADVLREPAPEPAEETARERIRRVVQAVVDHYCSSLFRAALHVWTAAASDPELRERVVPAEAELSRRVYALMADEIGVDMSHEPSRRKLQTTLDLARGLGLSNVLADDSHRRAKIVDAWIDDLDATLRLSADMPVAR